MGIAHGQNAIDFGVWGCRGVGDLGFWGFGFGFFGLWGFWVVGLGLLNPNYRRCSSNYPLISRCSPLSCRGLGVCGYGAEA